jgi:hypothetical protein
VDRADHAPYDAARRLLGWAAANFDEYQCFLYETGIIAALTQDQDGHWLSLLPPRLACSAAYAYHVRGLSHELRERFDRYLLTGKVDQEQEEVVVHPSAVAMAELQTIERYAG